MSKGRTQQRGPIRQDRLQRLPAHPGAIPAEVPDGVGERIHGRCP
jgi:hypothetical protein